MLFTQRFLRNPAEEDSYIFGPYCTKLSASSRTSQVSVRARASKHIIILSRPAELVLLVYSTVPRCIRETLNKPPCRVVNNARAGQPDGVGTWRLAGEGWSTKLQGCSYEAPALLPRTRPGAPSQLKEFWLAGVYTSETLHFKPTHHP